VSDEIDRQAHIQEAFDYSTQLGLDKGNGSATDRARHMKWMVANAEDHGELPARLLGWAHEMTGLLDGIGHAMTGKRPWGETWEETKRDLATNDFALTYQPSDEQIEAIVDRLWTEGHGKEAPDERTLYERQKTPKPSDPVHSEALPPMELAPGDAGKIGEFDIPTGYNPDPNQENRVINPENRRKTMRRDDI
jgi:hypothetical protein